jgi:hypothetical protein
VSRGQTAHPYSNFADYDRRLTTMTRPRAEWARRGGTRRSPGRGRSRPRQTTIAHCLTPYSETCHTAKRTKLWSYAYPLRWTHALKQDFHQTRVEISKISLAVPLVKPLCIAHLQCCTRDFLALLDNWTLGQQPIWFLVVLKPGGNEPQCGVRDNPVPSLISTYWGPAPRPPEQPQSG